MTQRDKWAQRPAVLRYRQFADELRYEFAGYRLGDEIELTFGIPMPKSWSKRKREDMIGKPHQQKPDIDNLCKAVMDALCEDDSYIYQIKARKFWAASGYVIIK